MSEIEKHKHNNPDPGSVLPEDAGSQALAEALKNSFFIVKYVLIALALVFLGSGFFIVGPYEKKVILHFGKPVGDGEKALLGPGIHWAYPYPIDEVVPIPANQIQTVNSTVGWYATTPEMEAANTEPPPRPSLDPRIDSYTLTSDANIVHVRARVQYRVTDPLRFYFEFVNAPQFVTNALNNAIYHASTQFKVDEILTSERAAFREAVAKHFQELVDEQHLGITLDLNEVQTIPPRQLAAKFKEVLQTSLRREDAINRARSYTNEVLARAIGDASAKTNFARADSDRFVQIVSAEAKKFEELLPEYQKDPELFKRVRQIETLQKVMTNVQEKFFIRGRADGRPSELRIQLNREPEKPVAPTGPPLQ